MDICHAGLLSARSILNLCGRVCGVCSWVCACVRVPFPKNRWYFMWSSCSHRVGRTFELWSLLNFNKVTVAVSVVCRPLTRCPPQCLHLTAFSNSSKVQVKTGWRPLSYLLKVVSLPSLEQGWVPLWGHHPYSWFSRQVLFTHNLCLIYLWLTKMLRAKTLCFCPNRRITEMRRMLMWEGRLSGWLCEVGRRRSPTPCEHIHHHCGCVSMAVHPSRLQLSASLILSL